MSGRDPTMRRSVADPVTRRHGQPANPVPLDVYLGDDPDLAMVEADMDTWMDAHPCDCEALCVCDSAADSKDSA